MTRLDSLGQNHLQLHTKHFFNTSYGREGMFLATNNLELSKLKVARQTALIKLINTLKIWITNKQYEESYK